MSVLQDFLNASARDGLQWAQAADEHAAKMERAGDAIEFASEQRLYDEARAKLLEVLLGSDAAAGLRLLRVPDLLQERDPSLFGLYNKIKGQATTRGGLTEFVRTVEAQLFVYPDRGPLQALVLGSQRFSRVADLGPLNPAAFFRILIAALKADSFWVPQGTASLDAFLKKMMDAGAAAGAGNAGPADEEAVRLCLAAYGWSWAALRDGLIALGSEDELFGVLGFRTALTAALMDRARQMTAPAALVRYGANFRWIQYDAPGSSRLTSDHDVSTRGSATETLVANFNTLFRGWTLGTIDCAGLPRADYAEPNAPCELDSGYVFDVNVYANDYIRARGRRFLVHDVPDADIWPAAPVALASAERFQDLYALLKIRRYIDDVSWTAFSTRLPLALTGPSRAATLALLTDVNNAWVNVLQPQVANLTATVIARPTSAGMPAVNARIRAENELYQQQLTVIEGIRNGGAVLDDADKILLAEALGKAGFYAQEGYHTSGAVRDVVANMQMRQGVPLRDMEVLCSLNEQMGDIFKEIGHAAGGAHDDIAFAVKTSKYMVRLGNAALSLNYRILDSLLERQFFLARTANKIFEFIGPTTAELELRREQASADVKRRVTGLADALGGLQKLCDAWRDAAVGLLEIKDAPAGTFTAQQKQARLDAAPWAQDGQTVGAFLVTLTVALNAQYRGGLRTDYFPEFLRAFLGTALDRAAAPH